MLADDCWLSAHDSSTGRPLLPARLMAVAGSASLLAELMYGQYIVLKSNHLTVNGAMTASDSVQQNMLSHIQRNSSSVESWLRFFARDAVVELGVRLVRQGIFTEKRSRSLLGKTRSEYQPADATYIARRNVRLYTRLVRNEPIDQYEAVLAGWIDATGLTRHILWEDPQGRGKRYLEHVVTYLPAEYRVLYEETNEFMNRIILGNH